MCRSCLNFIFHSPFNINIPSDYVWSAGRAGGFGLGDDWQIRLRGTIRAGSCGCKEDTDCCKIASLTMPALSSTFFRTPLHPLREERHFALFENPAMPYQPRLARNQFQVSHLDPTHASLRSQPRS